MALGDCRAGEGRMPSRPGRGGKAPPGIGLVRQKPKRAPPHTALPSRKKSSSMFPTIKSKPLPRPQFIAGS
ncbi:hypothetical protein KEM48_014082 [Puccinia striiformis f. sp. tritici PST-130]|nr:hypothetical protein KEM48_014082 [Puccinia striiformis f. sp. tritici PST-130]